MLNEIIDYDIINKKYPNLQYDNKKKHYRWKH